MVEHGVERGQKADFLSTFWKVSYDDAKFTENRQHSKRQPLVAPFRALKITPRLAELGLIRTCCDIYDVPKGVAFKRSTFLPIFYYVGGTGGRPVLPRYRAIAFGEGARWQTGRG